MSSGKSRVVFLAVLGLALVAVATPLQAQITMTGSNAPISGSTGSSSNGTLSGSQSIALGAADVLVVDVSTRNNNTLATGLDKLFTFTYGSGTLTEAVGAESLAGSYRDSAIFYMYNPPSTGTLSFSLSNQCSDYIIDAIGLGGVNVSAGATVVTGTGDGASSALATVSLGSGSANVQANAYAVLDQTLNAGTAPFTFKAATNPGNISSGTGSQLWTQSPDSNILAGGGVISGLNALTNSFSGSAASNSNNKNILVVAVFNPAAVSGEVWVGGTSTDWNTGGNWSPAGVPNAAGMNVTFGSLGASATSNLSVPEIVGTMTFDAAVPTTISGAALTLNNSTSAASITVAGSHSITAPITLASNLGVTANAGATLNIGGNIGDGGAGLSVSLLSGGTLVLGGNNTYSGATNVAAGALNVTGTLGNTPVNVGSGGILSLQNAGAVSQNTITLTAGTLNQTVANAIGGTTALSLSGGVTTLSQSNSYSGYTTVNSGATLLATNAAGSATGTSAVTINSGGTLGGSGVIASDVTVNSGGYLGGSGSLSGNVMVNSGGNLGGSGFLSGNVTVNSGGILSPHLGTGSLAATLNLSGTTSIASGTFNYNFLTGNVSDQIIANNLTLSGTETINVNFPNGFQNGTYPLLSATGPLNDTSTLTLAGTVAAIGYNLYTPGQAGNPDPAFYTLTTQVQTATWTGTASNTWDTATANWTGPAGTTFTTAQPVIFDDTAGTFSVSITGTGVSPYSVTFSNSANAYSISNAAGNVGISGSAYVTLNGSNTVTFNSPNTYTGGTFLNNGTLIIGNDNQLGNDPAAPATSITFNGGALSLGNGVTLNGNRNLQLNSGGGTISVAGGNTATINGVITGPGMLTVNGTGTLRSNIPTNGLLNTYSGGTVINGGVIDILNNGTDCIVTNGTISSGFFGSGPVTVNSGSTILMANYNTAIYANAFTFNGAFNFAATWPGDGGHGMWVSTTDVNGNALTTPNVTTIGAGGATFNFAFNGGHLLSLTQQVVGGPITLNGTSNGFLYLVQPSNTFSGLTINSGMVNMGGTSYYSGPNVDGGYAATLSGTSIIASNLGTGTVNLNGGGLENWKGAVTSVLNPIVLNGTVMLGNTNLAGPITVGSAVPAGPTALYGINSTAGVTSVISDAAGQHDPLVIASVNNTFTFSPSATSTYSGGTVVDETGCHIGGNGGPHSGDYAGVMVPSTAVLGTGGLTLLPGAKIRLGSASNLANGAQIGMTSNSAANAVLALAYDAVPNLTSASSGVIGIDVTNTTISNEAALGNGGMFLGTVMGGSLIAPTLAPGSGNLYRLGGGGPSIGYGGVNDTYTLTVNSVLADYNSTSSSLQVGNTAWQGGAVGGGVSLTQANTFSGEIDVYGPAAFYSGANTEDFANASSVLQGTAQTTAGASPFGSSTAAVNLHNGVLQLNGIGGGQAVSKGALGFEGLSRVVVNSTGAAYPTSLTFASIGRIAGTNGILLFNASSGSAGTAEQLISTAPVPMDATNTIVAPYMLYGAGAQGSTINFMTYNGASGFAPYASYVATPTLNNGMEVVSTAAAAPATNWNVLALKATGSLTGTGAITIASGGLISSGGPNTISDPLNFNGQEGVIFQGGGLTLSGSITNANGLTCGANADNGSITLSNVANSFSGAVTVNDAVLNAVYDNTTAGGGSSLGNNTNNIVLNGGMLVNSGANNQLGSGRTVILGASGGNINNATINGPITGPGILAVTTADTIASGANTYSGGTQVWPGGALVVTANATLGSGDLLVASVGNLQGTQSVSPNATATLQGDANLAATAKAEVGLGGTIYFQSAAPTFGNIQGAGSIVLGTSGSSTNLTIGGDNSSSTFYGTIGQVSGGTGSLTKQGTGTLTLAGVDTYSGATTVSGGTLAAASLGAIPTASAVSVTGGVLDVTAFPVTVGSISIGGAGALNLALGNVLTSSGPAAFNAGSTLNLSGSVGTLPETLMNYSGSASGTFSTADLNGALLANTDLQYLSGVLELTSTAAPSSLSVWQGTLSTSWTNAGNWSNNTAPNTVPNAAGAVVLVGSATAAPTTITLDSSITVGQLTLTATSAASGYTLATGSAGALTMDSGTIGVPAQILVTTGSHSISAPVSLAGALSIVPTAGTTLNIGGNISEQTLGAGSLSLDGPGTLVLGGSNSYTGGTTVTAAGATLVITSGSSIAPNTSLTIDAGGTLLFDPNGTADLVATASVSPAGAIAAVPEPGTLALLAAGLVAGFGVWRRRKGTSI